ncbi:hypothetical protein G2W53_025402 [Senna tora]|uniref:Uncharacterized protein n=1 Tax=Senna tora TaxID=362788 RepID=A0A834TF39_9FABA|nr:hypothetical protein G2W53_025402 [Senna tora]
MEAEGLPLREKTKGRTLGSIAKQLYQPTKILYWTSRSSTPNSIQFKTLIIKP